ncbi:ABC transporter ATP-binding protein [uncultured Limimaricola sp.]|uniref:ABC transporter ATP-binding protein n=1 Tax=uncultured Limimaricola sp. TaxID=2211667 RepID=UPI0030F95F4C
MPPIVSVRDLTKTYSGGFTALDHVSIDIEEGEIIALLGPNGAGKTTLISTVCGITMPSGGVVEVGGHDVVRDWRRARDLIGLVPQEIALEPFSTVWNNVRFTRGLFDRPRDDAYLERLLRDLSLWDKKGAKVMELSGGMKRRVLIAKALSHGPRVLFLDEPTAGVDVELRRDMWRVVERLRGEGVTIILTTHYIEEAEAIADRIGVISKGRIMLVERTEDLMARLGRKELRIELAEPVAELPERLRRDGLVRSEDGTALIYTYDTRANQTGITSLLSDLREAGLHLADLSTSNSSLEEIFVGLVKEDAA